MTLSLRAARELAARSLAGALLLCAAVVMPAECLGQSAMQDRPIMIQAIGDSITQGGRAGRPEYTYRWHLTRMLQDQGTCFAFVGSRHAGLDAAAQWPTAWGDAHDGYYGAKTAYVRDQLAMTLPFTAPPDIALVHLGSNDLSGSIGAEIIEPLRSVVRMLREANPAVTILIAQIPAPWPKSLLLHYRVRALARDLSTSTSHVVDVDQYSDWDIREDTFDGVHPNLRGQRKLAERWLEALTPFLKSTSAGTCDTRTAHGGVTGGLTTARLPPQ